MPVELIDKLDAIRQLSQAKFLKILDGIVGYKDLVIDASVLRCLERIVGMKILRSHKVNKVFKLAENDATPESTVVVYLIRGDLIKVKRVCDQIHSLSGNGIKRDYHIIAIPKVFTAADILLEEEGLYGLVKLHSYCWDLLELDDRLFSLELSELYRSLFVVKDTAYLPIVGKSLWTLQHIFGKFPLGIYIGSHAKSAYSISKVYCEEKKSPDFNQKDFGCVIVMDRDADYPSVLLTPVTYTSLVAETVGISTGVVDISSNNKQSMILSSNDEIYNQIKHTHVSQVITYLRQKIKDFFAEQTKRHNMTIQEMRAYVQNDLSKVANTGKVLSNHLHLCEKVINDLGHIFEELTLTQHNILDGRYRKEIVSFIEEIISTSITPHLPLRLIALLSVCQGGLTNEENTNLKMQFFHAFGHEHLLTFHKLHSIGLVCQTEQPLGITNRVAQVVSLPKRTAFQITAQKLKLIPDKKGEINLSSPQDASYVFGGLYVPVIVQLVNLLLKREKTLREINRLLPEEGGMFVDGTTLDVIPDISPKNILVYIIGGITYAEVAGLHFLEKKTGYRIICASTNIITGQNWAHKLLERQY